MKILNLLFALFFVSSVNAAEALSMSELLKQVQKGHSLDQQINESRYRRFVNNQNEQQTLLEQIYKQRQEAEYLSQVKEQQFENNEMDISALEKRLNDRLGSLKELFGVLQAVASDAQGEFYTSLTQIHYPNRGDSLSAFASKMEQTEELPTIEEIEQLWFELHREIVESGRVSRSSQVVLTAQGEEINTDVYRIGAFNLIANGGYLQRIPETGQLVELERQPSSRYLAGAKSLAELEQGSSEQQSRPLIAMTVDPIRGQLLSLLGTAPNMIERAQQGGAIGYIIIGLGIVVILLALARLLMLSLEEQRIERQMLSPNEPKDNPLGRVLSAYLSLKSADIDTLELKMSEAVSREVPRINRWLSFLKISAAVAPLLGLLGTVTGMIITFQAITLFGAGDPKLMAGGISQALVTTVLGLIVAIPSLLLHNLVQGKATKLTEILEQEAISIVAAEAEAKQ